MMQLPNGSSWPWRRTKKEEARLKKMVATTQLRCLGDRGRKKSKNGLDLIWIDNGFFFISRNTLARPIMGTIFLV